MTESLQSLLHRQAISVDFKPSDVESIVGASRHRTRRRRALATIAAVVAVALAGGGVVAVLGDGPSHPPPPPAGPSRTDVSWAVGSTIHVGAEAVDVGHTVNAYVRTANGFVILDDTDAVYSVTDDGVTQIGQALASLPDNTDGQRLVVDSSGTLVGWVDRSAYADALSVRIYRTTDNSTADIPAPLTTPDVHRLPGVELFAIDSGKAYWRTYEGVHEYDLRTGADSVVVPRDEMAPPDAIYSFEIYSVANGMVAYTFTDDHSMYVGPAMQDSIKLIDFFEYAAGRPLTADQRILGAEIIAGHTDPARLSPTGAWFSLGILEFVAIPVGDPNQGDADFVDQRLTPTVFDTTTGERIALATPDDMLAMPLVWLDDSTVQAVGYTVDPGRPQTPTRAVFYACSVPSGACTLAAELGLEQASDESVVFPDGRWYGQQ